MLQRLKIVLLFVLISASAAAAGIWLRIRYNVLPAYPLGCSEPGGAISVLFYAMRALKLPLLMFAAGFTIYASAVCGASCIYAGWLGGDLIYRCFLAEHFSGTAWLGYAMCVLYFIMYAMLAYSSSLNRSLLRTAAPAARSLAASRDTRRFFAEFLIFSSLMAALQCLIWFFTTIFSI